MLLDKPTKKMQTISECWDGSLRVQKYEPDIDHDTATGVSAGGGGRQGRGWGIINYLDAGAAQHRAVITSD